MSPCGVVCLNSGLGLKPCWVLRRKCIFLEHLFPFGWTGVADTIGFKVSDRLWHISHRICKALQKDLEKDFVSPFLALVSLHSSEGFNFIVKNKVHNFIFMKWLSNRVTPQGDDSSQGLRLRKSPCCKNPRIGSSADLFVHPSPTGVMLQVWPPGKGTSLLYLFEQIEFPIMLCSTTVPGQLRSLLSFVQWWSLSLNYRGSIWSILWISYDWWSVLCCPLT